MAPSRASGCRKPPSRRISNASSCRSTVNAGEVFWFRYAPVKEGVCCCIGRAACCDAWCVKPAWHRCAVRVRQHLRLSGGHNRTDLLPVCGLQGLLVAPDVLRGSRILRWGIVCLFLPYMQPGSNKFFSHMDKCHLFLPNAALQRHAVFPCQPESAIIAC